MKTFRPSLPSILAAFATVAILAAAALALDARAKTVADAAHRRALASLDADLALLSKCESLAETLSSLGAPPPELPLSVSLPSPLSSAMDDSSDENGWTFRTYSMAWKVPPRAALDILAALCNLDGTWHVSRLSFRSAGEGVDIEAETATARPANE